MVIFLYFYWSVRYYIFINFLYNIGLFFIKILRHSSQVINKKFYYLTLVYIYFKIRVHIEIANLWAYLIEALKFYLWF